MRCKKGVLFDFSIFPRAHLGSSASNLPWHPKWSPSVESKVYGAETKCAKGIAGYSIQAFGCVNKFSDVRRGGFIVCKHFALLVDPTSSDLGS